MENRGRKGGFNGGERIDPISLITYKSPRQQLEVGWRKKRGDPMEG